MTKFTLSCTSLMGWLLLSAPGTGHSVGGADSDKRNLAIARARETLRTTGVDPSPLTVTRAEPVTWPDSSLGCPRPGIQYLQVLTPGYRIELHGSQGDYFVHVAGNNAIVCTGQSGAGTKLARPATASPLVPLRGIDLMTQRAKEMLASAVHAPADRINVVGFEPQVWPDTGLGCPEPAGAVPGRVTGFKIKLENGGRQYTFNTDLHRVIACPAIEAE